MHYHLQLSKMCARGSLYCDCTCATKAFTLSSLVMFSFYNHSARCHYSTDVHLLFIKKKMVVDAICGMPHCVEKDFHFFCSSWLPCIWCWNGSVQPTSFVSRPYLNENFDLLHSNCKCGRKINYCLHLSFDC